MRELYRPLYLIETPFIVTSVEGAELIKYAANAFLATKISFINEIANLCEEIGCDVHDVAKAMGMDRRIGGKFLHPGRQMRCVTQSRVVYIQIVINRSNDNFAGIQTNSDL